MGVIPVILFSIAYMIKGGQFPIKYSKAIAVALVFLFVLHDQNNIVVAAVMAFAWTLAVHPSMGEEAGAIGRFGYWWGKYKERGFDRMYGVLKGVQRGAWMGAVFTVIGFPSLSIVIMAIGFPAAHFIGQEIYYRIHGENSWKLAEPLIGGLIGFCYLLAGAA